MTRDEYRRSYLRSPHWREIRAHALVAADHRCQVCNADSALDVHHRTYERIGHEEPSDLTVLCRRCHELFHDAQRANQASRSRLEDYAARRKTGPLYLGPPETIDGMRLRKIMLAETNQPYRVTG